MTDFIVPDNTLQHAKFFGLHDTLLCVLIVLACELKEDTGI